MDSSVYDAMVRLSQDFKMGQPLVDGHGNWGSIDGDSAAAMRYTEAKLQPIAVEMLQYLDQKVVEFVPNFDDNEIEPTILPSLVPNLFLNGTEGIAVGVRTEIPPHNLIELTNVIIACAKNPKISFEKLLEIMPAPDYPTGGIIVNKDDMLNMYQTGEGTVSIRSKIEMEQGEYGRTKLVITEIPYTQSGTKIKLIENIVDAVNAKKCDEISDIVDESKGDDVRIVIEVKKGSDIENIKNILYKETKLQDNQSCNFLVIDKQTPRVVDIKTYVELYLEFQEEILTKRYNLMLEKAIKKHEIDVGLLIAIDQIDVIIEVIRGSKTVSESKQCFMTGNLDKIKLKTKKYEKVVKTFSFTEAQANAILALQLSRLINLESQKILEDKTSLEKNIAEYNKIISDKKNLYKKIIENLKDMQKKYGKKRKTELTNSAIKVVKKAVIVENLEILIDRFGYVKAVDPIIIQKSTDDTLASYKQNFTAKSDDKLYIFTKSGLLNQVKVKDIPRAKMKDKGVPIDVLGKLDPNDEILIIVPFDSVKNKKILFIFDNGYVKKVEMSEYETNRQSIVATKLGDEIIVGIKFISSEEKLTLISEKKQYKVDLVELPLSKKTVKGTKACNLTRGTRIKEFKIKEI